jgi:FAD dependent oxidoreductase TIGR03364
MLVEHHRVDVCFGLPVIEVRGGERSVVVRTATGEMWEADVVVVCSGEDIATLYPKAYHASGIVKCKLQMLRTAPQPTAWRLGPHLAGGLTLRHYANFASCPSLPGLRERIASESAELDEYGIHVMAAQNGRGELVLGDSHEYANDFEPAERALIENLMLRELGRILRAPDLRIAERWHGIYAKRMKTTASGSWTEFIARPEPRVWLVNGIGGAGMTLSFGLAQEVWAEIQGGPMVATSPRSDSC